MAKRPPKWVRITATDPKYKAEARVFTRVVNFEIQRMIEEALVKGTGFFPNEIKPTNSQT